MLFLAPAVLAVGAGVVLYLLFVILLKAITREDFASLRRRSGHKKKA